MKTSRFFLHPTLRAASVLLLSIGLMSPAAQAQTFTGQAKLTQSPSKGFQVLIYASTLQPGRIRVNFDNESPGPVRIQVRDQQGTIVYDEFESSVHYRGYVNLLSAPTGDYTVSLSKPQGVYTQTFRIEPPTAGRIVLLNDGPAIESPKSEKLIVSH